MAGNYEKNMYNQLMEVMARLDAVEKDLSTEKIEHKEDVHRLNLKIDILTKENTLLHNENERLKSIINNDSSNTSLPPSQDQKGGKPSNTFNGRSKSDKKAGGQKGHSGVTLTKGEIEEKLKQGNCIHQVKNLGDLSTGKYITKYVLDLDIKPLITEVRIYADKNNQFIIPPEYRSDVVYGPNIKALSVTLYSEGVMSNDRIAAFLNAASENELALSAGSVYGFCKKFAEKSQLSIHHLEQELLNSTVVATDATNITVNGKQNYIRNFSIAQTVLYRAMKSKTIAAMHNVNFLERFAGTLVHDHETALYHFGIDHAECNVHIIRYLRKNSEDTKNAWSEKLITLLCKMNKERKEAMSCGKKNFTDNEISVYEKSYFECISQGRKENQSTKHKYAKKEETTLLNRLEKYSHNHLLFLHNFEIPFDDNMSERDLRKAKNRQKMAGGFRKDSGHEMYCSILTIIETLKRRKMAMIEHIRKIFIGTPAIF